MGFHLPFSAEHLCYTVRALMNMILKMSVNVNPKSAVRCGDDAPRLALKIHTIHSTSNDLNRETESPEFLDIYICTYIHHRCGLTSIHLVPHRRIDANCGKSSPRIPFRHLPSYLRLSVTKVTLRQSWIWKS